MGRAKEKRGQQPDLLSCREFYSMMQGPSTPLADRGLRHIQIHEGAPFEGPVPKMPHPWDLVYAKGTRMRLPAEVTGGLAEFSGKTPASSRPSIGAAVALVELHKVDRMEQAGSLWHIVALLPHSLICDREHGRVCLVLTQGRFAARVWIADKLELPSHSPATGASEALVQEVAQRSWVFCTVGWEWLVVTDIQNWFFLPFTWQTNTVLCNQYGCMRAEEAGVPVPALAEAFVTKGRRRLIRHDRTAFHQAFGIQTPHTADAAQVKSGDKELMRLLLDGHPNLQQYMERLEDFHKWEATNNKRRRKASAAVSHSENSSSGLSDQGSGQQCALTVAALGDMDEANKRAWQQERKTRKMMGMKGTFHAARGILRAERQQRAKGEPQECIPASGAVRCNISWARQFVPGTKQSGITLPEGVTRSCLEMSQVRQVWVARYKHPTLQAAGFRPTRSKSYKDATEHQAFQIILRWLWNRHESCCKAVVDRPH